MEPSWRRPRDSGLQDTAGRAVSSFGRGAGNGSHVAGRSLSIPLDSPLVLAVRRLVGIRLRRFHDRRATRSGYPVQCRSGIRSGDFFVPADSENQASRTAPATRNAFRPSTRSGRQSGHCGRRDRSSCRSDQGAGPSACLLGAAVPEADGTRICIPGALALPPSTHVNNPRSHATASGIPSMSHTNSWPRPTVLTWTQGPSRRQRLSSPW